MLGKLHKMMVDGELTPYLYTRCLAGLKHLPNDMQEQMLSDATLMSLIGINSEDDHKHFLYVTMHIKKIANEIAVEPLSNDQLAKVSYAVYKDRLIHTIDTILNFYKAADRAMRNLELPIKKVAYPVGMGGNVPDQPRDVAKWMNAMRGIYARVHRGLHYETAFDKVTSNWDTMEKHDFKAWQRFYTEGTQHKYKTAQTSDYYQAQDGSPLLPFRNLRAPGADGDDLGLPQHIEDEKQKKHEAKEAKEAERLELIKEYRRKLLSRINSSERIVTDIDARDYLDMNLDQWLETLHSLKRSIQSAPIRSAASPILYDLIIRRGNQLKHEGYVKSGNLLMTLAQGGPTAPPVGELAADDPAAEDPLADLGGDLGGGDLGDLTEGGGEGDDSGWSDDFVKMLNNEHLDEADDEEADDELLVEAQAIPEAPIQEELPMEELVEEPTDIEVEDTPGNALEAAMEDVTIEGVIETLEMVSNIIQNREIPRQLSFADMQMGKLGVATFFPSLGEAIRSMLESHQYTQTRVEDILSKLRGSIQPAQQMDLTPDETSEEATSETLEAVRRSLTEGEEADKARSEARKAKREAREGVGPVAPAVPAAPPITPEEIAGPVEVESAPPTRAT